MSGPIRVSAIIIFLNEERFLEEAVESVLRQDCNEWELILVDDGSTDDSTRLARAYAAREPTRIRYTEHPGHANRGMSASRNLGVSYSRGDYVAFLDADDVWLPNKLREQLALFESYPEVDLVYGRTLLWHSWRGIEQSHRDGYCDLGMPPDTVVSPPTLLVSLIRNRAQTPTTCNALIRRDAIARVGGFDTNFRGMFEDQVFFMKLSLTARAFVASREWARYRQRDDSCSARAEASGQIRSARRQLLDWLRRYLREQQVRAPEIWRELRRQYLIARWPVLLPIYAWYEGLRRAVRFHVSR